MKKLTLAVLLVTIAGCDLFRADKEPDGTLFEQLHGQSHSMEWATSMSSLSGGGNVITGSTDGIGFGQQNILLMKTDAKGELLWQKSFGAEGYNEMGRSVVETSQGDYLVLGSTESEGNGASDMYLIKTDSNGNVRWTKTYGTPLGEEGMDILPVDDGYLLLGNTKDSDTFYSDYYLIKVDANGTRIWEKGFDGPQTLGASGDMLGQLKATPDGGFVVAGTQGYIDATGFTGLAWILKLNGNGLMEWDRTLGTVGRDDAQANDIVVLGDRYMIIGTRLNANEETDFYIARLNESGILEWDKRINRSSSDQGIAILNRGTKFTIAGIGWEFELDRAYQVYLLSFRNMPE